VGLASRWMVATLFAFDEEGDRVFARVLLLSFSAGLSGVSVPTPNPAVPSAALPSSSAPLTQPRNPRADAALNTLSGFVVKQSHPEALRVALEAYYNFRSAQPEQVRKPYLYYIDYGLDNRTPRGYVFDMEKLRLIDGPFVVAHGRGSSTAKNGVPSRFSNRPGSATTSLGLYVAQETYAFSGKSGGRRYNSIGLRLKGVSGRFNSTARARGIVVHGAPYVTASGSGRSEGCPAMEQARARRLIPMIANGGLVFHFSPRDTEWLNQDPWLQSDAM
jgi:hypothetical protein